MSSSILHQCPHCGHASDISNALAAFIENPHCKQVDCVLPLSYSTKEPDQAYIYIVRDVCFGKQLESARRTFSSV